MILKSSSLILYFFMTIFSMAANRTDAAIRFTHRPDWRSDWKYRKQHGQYLTIAHIIILYDDFIDEKERGRGRERRNVSCSWINWLTSESFRMCSRSVCRNGCLAHRDNDNSTPLMKITCQVRTELKPRLVNKQKKQKKKRERRRNTRESVLLRSTATRIYKARGNLSNVFEPSARQ